MPCDSLVSQNAYNNSIKVYNLNIYLAVPTYFGPNVQKNPEDHRNPSKTVSFPHN